MVETADGWLRFEVLESEFISGTDIRVVLGRSTESGRYWHDTGARNAGQKKHESRHVRVKEGQYCCAYFRGDVPDSLPGRCFTTKKKAEQRMHEMLHSDVLFAVSGD